MLRVFGDLDVGEVLEPPGDRQERHRALFVSWSGWQACIICNLVVGVAPVDKGEHEQDKAFQFQIAI